MVNANLGPGANLAVRIQRIENRLDNLMTTPWLQNASTGSGIGQPGIKIDTSGVHAFNASDQQVTAMLTADGSVTAFDASGNPVARFGPLTVSNPGFYGVEVLVAGVWTTVGGGTVTWGAISGVPSTFPPSAHTHAGTDITSAVSDSSGSSHAYNYNVGGTSYFAVWVGNDAGNNLGKNVSSARYKSDIREHRIDPARVLALQPVLYSRKQNEGVLEYGLIAEQVNEHVPELTQWYEGKIDSYRSDLLAVALLEVVKDQDRRIRALEGHKTEPAPTFHGPETRTNNAPAKRPAPHPYTIRKV